MQAKVHKYVYDYQSKYRKNYADTKCSKGPLLELLCINHGKKMFYSDGPLRTRYPWEGGGRGI